MDPPVNVLDPEHLIEHAVCATGLADFGPPGFRAGLDELVAALTHDRGLSREGLGQAYGFVLAPLTNRLLVARQAADHPEIGAIPIVEPVFILGLPRSGTTALHRLLARHPRMHAPRLWELNQPVTPAGMSQADLIRASDHRMALMYRQAPAFRAIHPTAAEEPEECTWLLANEMAATLFSVNFDIPSYTTWLLAQDMIGALAGHRRQLQHLLWRRPATGTLLLKDPYHGLCLPAIDANYPDARYIVLRRDPSTVTASLCSLVETIRRVTHERVDLAAIGMECTRLVRTLVARQESLTGSDRAILVEYDDLLIRPMYTAERVLDFLRLPLDDRGRQEIRRYLAEHPQHRHGTHRYRPDRYLPV